MNPWPLAAAVLALMALAAAPALAGSACSQRAPTVEMMERAGRAALHTEAVLERSGASLVLIGRVGADISDHGLRYTHAALAMRQHPMGRWGVRHMLNHCGRANSALYDQGLMNFFLDDLYAYDALIMVPDAGMQERIANEAFSPLALALYEPHYNMLANPFSTRYQNSNQWLLELIAAAEAPPNAVQGRTQAQRWLREAGYRPTPIRLSFFERAGGELFRANVSFDDHSEKARDSGVFPVVTVRSLRDYLRDSGHLVKTITVREES